MQQLVIILLVALLITASSSTDTERICRDIAGDMLAVAHRPQPSDENSTLLDAVLAVDLLKNESHSTTLRESSTEDGKPGCLL